MVKLAKTAAEIATTKRKKCNFFFDFENSMTIHNAARKKAIEIPYPRPIPKNLKNP